MAKFTVSNYPRNNLTPKTDALLDALAANPATRNLEVNSGYRSPTHNKRAGGAGGSQHIHGNAVDIDVSGLTDAQKREALQTAISAGAKGIGVYPSGNSLHIDPRATPSAWGPFSHGKYAGAAPGEWHKMPEWAREVFQENNMYFESKWGVELGEQLPEKMTVPGMTREQALASTFQPENINRELTGAYTPVARPPAMPGGLSQISRAPLGPQREANQRTGMPSPSLPALSRPTVGPARENPPSAMRSPASSISRAPVSNFATRPSAAPRGAVDSIIDNPIGLSGGPMLGASIARNVAAMAKPAAPSAAKTAAAYGQYGATRTAADEAAANAAAYAAYEANRAKAFTAMPGPPPAQVLAPALNPIPTEVKPPPNIAVMQPLPTAPRTRSPYVAPPAPVATASDVYSGLADTALDNTGKNTVSRDAFGNTNVTNQWGAKTAMNGQYQAATSLPGIAGPIGSGLKSAAPAIGGGLLGTMLAGPLGGIVGAALAKEVAKPGGLFSGQKNFDTNWFGNITTNKPQGGLGFPDTPTHSFVDRNGNTVRGYTGRADFSNRSRADMDSISPGASRAIGRGLGGLY